MWCDLCELFDMPLICVPALDLCVSVYLHVLVLSSRMF